MHNTHQTHHIPLRARYCVYVNMLFSLYSNTTWAYDTILKIICIVFYMGTMGPNIAMYKTSISNVFAWKGKDEGIDPDLLVHANNGPQSNDSRRGH